MNSAITVRVSNIRFLSTGADGGHIYVRGTGEYEGCDTVDIYVHFDNKEQEVEFKDSFQGGIYEFSATRWDFLTEIGLSLWNADFWRRI